ncbi:MAG: PspC domain-containing protein [Bacteroidota bacterium]|nr:PspC domain-containing protein [Bacteroidota bacterium]
MQNGTKDVKRLYRSTENKIIGGVCGGFAEYLNVDPVIIRILWVIMIFIGGTGILLYLIAWILMPLNTNPSVIQPRKSSAQIWGALLIVIGGLFLMSNLNLFPIFDWFEWWDIFSWGTMVSLIIIAIGVLLIFNHFKISRESQLVPSDNSHEVNAKPEQPYTSKILRRSVRDKKLAGVCGGLAEYLDIDSTIMRLIFILLTLGSFGLGLFLYIVLAIVMPQGKLTSAQGG